MGVPSRTPTRRGGPRRRLGRLTSNQSLVRLLWRGQMTKHPFHIVDYSPWPLTGSLGSLFLVSGLAAYINKFDHRLIGLGLILILATMCQ